MASATAGHGVGGVHAAAGVWAFFGSVPTRATGRGVLLADGKASHTVQPVVSGPVVELLVSRGQQVEADALIARIEQVSLNTQLASNTARVAMDLLHPVGNPGEAREPSAHGGGGDAAR